MYRFGRRQVPGWTVYVSLGLLLSVLFLLVSFIGNRYQGMPQSHVASGQDNIQRPVFITERHVETDNLIHELKQHGLWKIPSTLEVPRFFIESYPADLYTLDDVSLRKKVFLHSLLPHALLVREEALRKRAKLEAILGKIDCSLEQIDFVESDPVESSYCSWSDFLQADEVSFIEKLCSNYRATTAEELLERVDAVPTSIILAQGALESSWGSSRFTREGNSIFGMWTWKTKGIVPARRDEGKTHKVKAYENVLDSVRAYHLTLNRLDPYDEFRQLRRHTDDPLILAEGLTLYSERGEEYVEDIKRVILSNDLQKYDNCSLSDYEISQLSGSVIKNTASTEPGKASL